MKSEDIKWPLDQRWYTQKRDAWSRRGIYDILEFFVFSKTVSVRLCHKSTGSSSTHFPREL